MIYCPECGTANRDGSRFCNECGYQLGSRTGVKCPQCGTMNSIQSAFCSECGGRLLSLSTPGPGPAAPPIKGLSLPTKPEVGEDAAGGAREPGAEGEAPEGEVPSWLRELGATPPTSIADQPQELDAFSPTAPATEEIPDWLRDLGASMPEEMDEAKQAEAPAAPIAEAPLEEPIPEEVPDWLAALRPAEAPAAPIVETPLEEPAPGEVPDWLAELRREAPAAPSAEVPEAEVSPGEPEEVPDWLAALRPAEAPAAPIAETPLEEPAPGEVPGWLAELRGEESAAPSAEVPEAEVSPGEPEEVPDWLAALRPAEASTAPIAEAPLEEPVPGEVPDWLAALRPAEAPAVPIAETPLEEPAPEEVPDWLRDLGMAGVAAEGIAASAPPAGVPEEELELPGEMPDWLAALGPAAEPAPAAPPLAAAEIPEAAAMPDWLSALRPTFPEPLRPSPGIPTVEGGQPGDLAEGAVSEAPEEELRPDDQGLELDWLVPTPEGPGLDGETLARAEIPAWLLALKPRELKAEGEEAAAAEFPTEEFVEQTGLLAGIRNVLPVEMLIAQPRAAVPAAVEAAPVETPQAQLFAQIVALPLVTAPKTLGKPESRLMPPLARGIIYALLLLLVAVPLLLKEPLFEREIEPAPSATDLYDVVDSLNNGDAVLVAFDYDPATSGEMDLLAELLVSHLMDKQARIVVVSLLPTGPAAAQNLVEKVAVDYPDYQDDQSNRYANLGYLPGQAAAVRLMSQSLSQALPRDWTGRSVADLPVMAGIASAQDFDLIVELAAGVDTLRWWIEQAGTPYDLPLVAGVSAAVDPMARPYYETESQQLQGEIGGVLGAASYESLRTATLSGSDVAGLSQPMVARLDSQLAGHVVIILVIVIGNVIGLIGLIRGRTGRKR